MEEAQYSEDLFSTQDEAAFGNANSEQEASTHKSTEEKDVAAQPGKDTASAAEKEVGTSAEQETPDLVFSEDIDFGKESSKNGDNSSSNAGVTSDNFEELMEPDVNVENADERTETEEVVESSVPNPNAADAASTKESPEERLAQFPFARIKQMMKLDPEVGIVSAEAIFLVTKAAELFLQTLAKDTSFHTVASKKKTMSKRDVETAIDNVDSLVFLEGMMNV
ncbi:DNA polymerase epsilon subunit 4 [Anopheles gambiae]|uniref:DNA polymerase epsilon subunit 4 n=1 Tax=Anopheles gambiae TaxID=7165 RepID=UPI002AC8DE9A|nr:DNA polymerase epsilon subunit 4 [Anopheles gambiae]